MGNWWVNAYCIGFIVSCVIFLPMFSGIIREHYIWEKAFWIVPYEDKGDRAAAYGTVLFASLLWPVTWAAMLFAIITVLFYWCCYHIFKKLR